MPDERFCGIHDFPREVSFEAIRNIFSFVDGKIGTNTEIADEREKSMKGFIFKNYDEGLAYALMTFGIKGVSRPFKDQKYCAVTLWADADWGRRKGLTARLDTEVEKSLADYFNMH